MTIEIEVPMSALSKLFESETISAGMVHEIPGGASLKLGPMPMEKRHVPGAEHLVLIIIKVAGSTVIGSVVKYLLDKLKDGKKKGWVRISREEKIEITPEA